MHFFVPEWISENPDQLGGLIRFQKAMEVQILVLSKALEAYKIFGSVQTKPHCEHLTNLFEKMKIQLAKPIKEDISKYLKKEDFDKIKEN